MLYICFSFFFVVFFRGENLFSAWNEFLNSVSMFSSSYFQSG